MRHLLQLVFLSLVACSTPSDNSGISTTETKGEEPKPMVYSLTLTTGGGFTGRGVGDVRVDDRGAVVVTDMARREIRSELTSEERDRFASAVRAAVPQQWRDAAPSRGADLITYTLNLQRDGESGRVEWMDGGRVTADAEKLGELLAALRARVVKANAP